MKQLRLGILLLIAAAGFFGGGWLLRRALTRPVARRASVPALPVAGSKLFEDVFEHVREFAVDSIDDAGIYRLAASGVLGELDDPYAALVPGRDTASVSAADPPQGLYLDLVDELVTVVAVVPDSPGAEAGVVAGDAILRVGGTNTDQLRPEAVGRLLQGAGGSTVRLRLDRPTVRTPLFVTIRRGPVPALPSPSVSPLGGGITHLRLYRIDRAAATRARQVADSAADAGSRALVLDLRGVVEGSLEDGAALAEQFLDPGQTIVVSRGRVEGDTSRLVAHPGGRHLDLPIVVVVDRGTSGAAEVVAGALQDHDQAAIVGEATFGRGGRQSFYPVGNGYLLRLTTSHWLTPSGRVIQRVPPPRSDNPAVPDSAPPRPKFQTESGRTVLGGGGIVPDREVTFGHDEAGSADPAMAMVRQLLSRARDRKTLIAALRVN